MLAAKSKREFPELIVQPRRRKRSYVFDYHAWVVDKDGKEDFFAKGGGVSVEEQLAKKKALCEALERYCGSHVFQPIKRASYDELGADALNPSELIYFLDSQYLSQFLYRQFDRTQPIDWVEGYSLIQKRKIFVPAFAVYIGYNRLVPPEERFVPTTSCGLALHLTEERAVINAIFELLERDAAIITWLTQKRIPRVDLRTSRNHHVKFLREQILQEGLQPEVLVGTLDIPIPIVIGLIYDPKESVPIASFGIAVEETLEDATAKALEEALMIRSTLEILKEENKLKPLKHIEVKNFLDHAIFYAFPSQKKFFEFLLEGPMYSFSAFKKKLRPGDTEGFEKLEGVLNLLKSNQIQEVVKVRVSPELVEKMGFVAARVIIPQLQPMDINYNARFLSLKRVSKFLKPGQKLNSLPHPFA